MNFLNTVFIGLFFSTLAFANVDYNNIFIRQEQLHNSYKEAYLVMTDINKTDSVKTWYRLFAKSPKNIEAFKRYSHKAKQAVLGGDYRNLIYYYSVTGQSAQAAQVLGLYLISGQTFLDNFIKDPNSMIWSENAVRAVEGMNNTFDLSNIKKAEKCFENRIKIKRGFHVRLSTKIGNALKYCVALDEKVNGINLGLQYLFHGEKYHGAPFPISFTGFTKGNKIKVLNGTTDDKKTIESVSDQLHLLKTSTYQPAGKLYKDMTIKDFKEAMTDPESAVLSFFTEKEGYIQSEEHGSFQNTPEGDPTIYRVILNSIRNAKESVFIDVFWLGGSVGINLAKELFRKVNANSDFTVHIITDNDNKFNYGPEMDVVYRYMRAYSEKFTQKNFYIAPAHISLKRTALPEFIDLLVTDSVVADVKSQEGLKSLMEGDGFHLLGKSDHSKVFVIDGKNPKLGQAFVGSKNWSDTGSAFNLDDMIQLEGPAVQVILNSFYYDVFEAFSQSVPEEDLTTKAMMQKHLKAKFPIKEKSFERGLRFLLKGIDVLGRYRFKGSISSKNIKVPYEELGKAVVSPAQNNIYGTEVSAIEQNIQIILSAKHQILIDDQFFYDPAVIEAIKAAHSKGVKIYLLLETLQSLNAKNNEAAHIPNNLFLKELSRLGIPAKWKLASKEVKSAVLKETKKYPGILSTTFHVKSLSADGVLESDAASCLSGDTSIDSLNSTPVLITGSANKDVMTMSGGFREYQVAVYDSNAVISHDCLFWKMWNDKKITKSTDGLDFDIPQKMIEAGVTDKEAFLGLIKSTFFAPYSFTKDFFN